MQPLDIGYYQIPPTSYCLDYLNRKKGDKECTLEKLFI